MQIGQRQINGVDTEVHATPDGNFSIMIEGKSIGMATTLDAAVTEARNTINRDKTIVNVAFITKDAGERGVATGFHSRNRTILAKISGVSMQLDYGHRAFKPDMPKAKLDRFFKIRDEIENLKIQQREIEATYSFTVREEVQQAITDAQKKTLAGAVTQVAARRTRAKR